MNLIGVFANLTALSFNVYLYVKGIRNGTATLTFHVLYQGLFVLQCFGITVCLFPP